MKDDIKKSVTKVMMVFLFCLIALITYIAYFQAFKAPDIAAKPGNQRAWAVRNRVLRGTIYDRNNNVIAKSVREKNNVQKRVYPDGAVFAAPIGFMDSRFGGSGLEAAYDKQLTTTSNMTASFKKLIDDPSIANLKEAFFDRKDDKDRQGNSVVTTLDSKLQKVAYNALGNDRGAVVALDPKTGNVLAMVSKPTYNPNNLAEEMKKANSGDLEHSILLNRAIQGQYPPGSTFKVVTTASALDNIPGVQNKTFTDNGVLKFEGGGKELHNSGDASYGSLDLKKAFVVSSNVVYGTLAMDLGNDKLMKTAERFGFNEQIPANGFTIGKSTFPKLTYSGDIARSGIGQSTIIVNPMQMALVASAVANNGVIMQPNLVSKVVDKDGTTIEVEKPKEYQRAMSEDDAATIKSYMKALVDKNIQSGTWSYLQGTGTAGKTGTADHNLPNGQPAPPHSWFICFAPADNPKIAVAVVVEDGGYGAKKAASVAGKVINAELNK
ncbi:MULTISPECIES: peptidoglycan D,D-transpeptidase FtsI family protein [Clostridium]|uniref:Penicillin-binding protein 2 n=1 Tax=Clostridium nitritogenes TaxID=83340 RepID=A0ABN1LFM7_9CLOT|nr:penicillin-binding transpeptidase domain-containing protein [Clostridium baratii]AQM58724.1 penicillin-binding protein [Clostridium baratii]KJU72293.1 penicillin-binding protein [Clostridium baratii]